MRRHHNIPVGDVRATRINTRPKLQAGLEQAGPFDIPKLASEAAEIGRHGVFVNWRTNWFYVFMGKTR